MKSSAPREVATYIAGYFRDFLESDFKRIQEPSRRILLQSDSCFRSGMPQKPYEALDRDFWRLLQHPSGESLQLKIAPRKYTRNLSAIDQKVITLQIATIDAFQLASTALKDHIDETIRQSSKRSRRVNRKCHRYTLRGTFNQTRQAIDILASSAFAAASL